MKFESNHVFATQVEGEELFLDKTNVHSDDFHDDVNELCAGLSNDYLNHYSEVLMLLEMSGEDLGIASELEHWQVLDYVTYFRVSTLRRAPAALVAYDVLSESRKLWFETLLEAMDQLALVAISVLLKTKDQQMAAQIVSLTCIPFRQLIDRAAAFLNSASRDTSLDGEIEAAYVAIEGLGQLLMTLEGV